ncbi:hypothetical protein PIB30_077739 [Stylosanthes scabra]|uniref:Uncharacterized protein n=1 Tax=Stylosanthes scabra TaxID=79078 RepID=A0ABU6SRV4_9FABA|nr:hypothetical protein [Stylosanthes scabra]
MSGTHLNTGGSDSSGLTVSAGSIAPIGPNTSTASAQSSAAFSISVGSTRSNTEFEQKQVHDDNRSNTTAGSNLISGTNGGGNGNGRGLRPRVEQPFVSSQLTGGWAPTGFSDMNRNIASSCSNPPLSTATVRHLIEESYLDLGNLLTLDPIVADTNAKYEKLAKRFDNILGGNEDIVSDPYVSNGRMMEETCELGHNLENDEMPVPEQIRLLRRGENAEHVLHNISTSGRLAQRQVVQIVENMVNRIGIDVGLYWLVDHTLLLPSLKLYIQQRSLERKKP